MEIQFFTWQAYEQLKQRTHLESVKQVWIYGWRCNYIKQELRFYEWPKNEWLAQVPRKR